jgi:hypothetical protein
MPGAAQFQLFARRAVVEYPKTLPSADSLGEAEADDGHRYYIKGDINGVPIRASEWISTHLAEEVQLAAPAPAVIERLDGSTVFGSRRIASVADAAVTTHYLQTPSASNQNPPVPGLSRVLSSIYALDMFIHNEDRHLGNYLSVDDNGVRRMYAFDFSRALFWRWPWTGFVPNSQNTRTCGALLRANHGFDTVAAQSTLDRIGQLAPSVVESFINRMPPDWLQPSVRVQFLSWWSSTARTTRLDDLRKGFSDGTLL